MKLVNLANKIIEYSFYALFLFVPLVFTSKTSEIFELNKVWLIFGLTIVIGFSWILKMIILKRIFVQRTPLDIPIILFLASQIISTVISLDPHVSLWGYYSRFNGGLLSIISYIFLYYAFLSNFNLEKGELKKIVMRIIKIGLISGFIVALWGLPSHFGFDPTCRLLNGSFDVSCWTAQFQPKIRIFSTLGQPDWLGAYLAILLPISIGFFLNKLRNLKTTKDKISAIGFLLLSALFYADIVFTKSKSAFLAFWISFFFLSFFFLYFEKVKLNTNILKENTVKILVGITAILLIITFFAGQPFTQLDKFTFSGIQDSLKHTKEVTNVPVSSAQEFGGTDSGKIRLLVWKGALNAWMQNRLIGTGVETFAFAYYKYRPIEHNTTSEWDYLYNKAHNEFLNYLATTGILGLGTYLFMIGTFVYLSLKNLFKIENLKLKILISSLLAGYLSILITNFFGFSISITNIYLFLIPTFTFVLLNLINSTNVFSFPKALSKENSLNISIFQKLDIVVAVFFAFFLIFNLFNFWTADILYAYGQGLDGSGEYQKANAYLRTAVEKVSFEPVFKDSLSLNDATLTLSLIEQTQGKDSKTNQLIQGLAGEAVGLNDQLTKDYPNNIIFLKSRVKIFYTLSQIDPKYLSSALDAIKKAQNLAPNDAKVSYNLGLLYGQTGDNKNAIKTLEDTIKLKPNLAPDYNPYYALGIFYHQEGVNDKAISEMEFILKNLDRNNKDAKDAIDAWNKL